MLFKQIKLALLCTATLLVYGSLKAQDKSISPALYVAAAIPDSLKEDAYAVIRYNMVEINVTSAGRAVIKQHRIVTLLDEKARSETQLVVGYNQYNSIGTMQMTAYNADGKLIKKYTKGDAYDQSATSDGTLVSTERLKALQHSVGSYPVTIETVSEQVMNSRLDLPTWYIRPDETSVQQSFYKVTVNPALGFRYKNKHTGIQPQKLNDGKNEVYTWQVNNLKAQTPEDDIPGWCTAPKILFTTNNFEFNGIPGSLSSWQEYGKWQLALNADVCSLTPQRAEEIKQLTANLQTDKEKAKFLYHYVQQNMRYVSIQLGIGGLKPFPAMFVDQKKYGDCKALSNYMYALLKAVNIRAHYALINAGTNAEPADADFPADPFNHIVLCIPFKNDTTWLECTSNTQAFGKLGAFTENRTALLITEDGGKLVCTPKSAGNDNQFNSQVQVTLNAEGGATAKVKIISTGEFRDLFVDGLPTISQDKQREYLIRSLNFRQPAFFDFKPATDAEGVNEANFELEYDNFTEVAAGNKKFYRPRVFDVWSTTLPVVKKRQADFYFDHPMQKACTTVISLPAGFEAESLPENVSLKFAYGNYEANYKYDAAKNEVTSIVKFNINQHIVPAGKYPEMQQYMDSIAKAQNKKLVIRKKV
jgi:hypothetical protein